MNRTLGISLLLSGSLLMLAEGALAQSWSELNARQQEQLSDFQMIWPGLSEQRRRQLVRNAPQIARMSPTNRQKLVNSMSRIAGGNDGNANRGSSFQDLSPERQQELIREWNEMSPEEREGRTPPQQR